MLAELLVDPVDNILHDEIENLLNPGHLVTPLVELGLIAVEDGIKFSELQHKQEILDLLFHFPQRYLSADSDLDVTQKMGQVYLYLIVAIITRGRGSTLFEADSVAAIVDKIAGKAGTIRRLRFFTQDQGSVEKIESGLETVKSIHPKVKSRLKGVPEDWPQKETNRKKKRRGVEYINPNDHRDRVRVMEGVPRHPRKNSRSIYIRRTMDGKFYDKYGNAVEKKSDESHIPYNEFTFFPKEQLND